jgi:hypothetical protein
MNENPIKYLFEKDEKFKECIKILEDSYPNDFALIKAESIDPLLDIDTEHPTHELMDFYGKVEDFNGTFEWYAEGIGYAKGDGFYRGKDCEPGFIDINEECRYISEKLEEATNEIYANIHGLGREIDSGDKTHDVKYGSDVAFNNKDLLNAVDLNTLKSEPELLLHLLGHFTKDDNEDIIDFLLEAGISESKINDELNKPGSKFFGSLEEYLHKVSDSIKLNFTSGKNVVLLEFPRPIGTSNITPIAEGQEARKITHGNRTGFKGVLNKGALAETTSSYIAFTANEEGKVLVSTIVSGLYAPKKPLQFEIEALEILKSDLENRSNDAEFYSEIFPNASWCPKDIKEEVYDKLEYSLVVNDNGKEVKKYNIEEVIEALINLNKSQLDNNEYNDRALEFWENTAFVYTDTKSIHNDTRPVEKAGKNHTKHKA